MFTVLLGAILFRLHNFHASFGLNPHPGATGERGVRLIP